MRKTTKITRLKILIILLCLMLMLTAPAFATDLLSQGLAAQKAGKNAAAVELLGKYIKDHPNAAQARRGLALALSALDKKTEALAALEPALAQNPKDVGLLVLKGKILGELERRGEAVTALSQVLALEPNNVEALKERGDNLAQEGQFAEALKDYDRAAALAPKDPWLFQKRGMAKFCMGNYREAVADLGAAIKLAPDAGLFYFCRGEIYLLHLHQKDKALADFQKGCSLGHPLCCRELEKMGIKPKNN